MLSWVNAQRLGGYQRMEDLFDGVWYCALFARHLPAFPYGRVVKRPRTRLERERNFQVLDSVFCKQAIERLVPASRLSEQRLQ
eukprot:SAG22_NODE_13377_length_409_cov_0.664516_1_plen_82_part_10